MLLRGSGQAGSEGASLNYYERHIGDYLKDTSHLSLLEHGIYTRLLDVYYTREGAIPEEQAARLIGARTKDEREALQAVLSEFFELTADGWAQQRCEREIARYQDKQRKAKASADARWNAQRPQSEGNANALPDAMRTHSEGNALQTPDTSNQNTEEPTVLVGKASPTRPPDCPTGELLSLYHQHLPMLPRVEVVNDGRKRALSARWREVVTDPDIRKAPDPRAAALNWFAWFFGHVAGSKFLTGRAKDWKADFDFLMTPSKFAKVVEGSYHKEAA